MALRTREEIETEMEKIDGLLNGPPLQMYQQTYLDAAKQALGWALGDYTDGPVVEMNQSEG